MESTICSVLSICWTLVVYLSLSSHSLPANSIDPKIRNGRQVFPGVIVGSVGSYGRLIIGGDLCTFGNGPGETTLCGWNLSNLSTLQWELTFGLNSNWIGGPRVDASEGDEGYGGYMIYETSQIPNISGRASSSQSAVLEGPIYDSSTSLGSCFSFNYAIDGLSPEKMRVLLHPIMQPEPGESAVRYTTIDGHPLLRERTDHGADVVLWETRDSTDGSWKAAEVVYTCRYPHQIYLEGIPRDPATLSRRYRGYIAIDNLDLKSSKSCPGHCNFDGGFCDWINEKGDEEDDFDWSLSRGSQNPSTGPLMDRASYTHGGSTGGYAYIDSSYPAKSGDKARLSSKEPFSATGPDSPLCMRFWTHMYGNGIGTLRVILHDPDSLTDRIIWSLSGEAGNAWYQGQVPISSLTPFKIVFEGEVGRNNLGDIAIDDVSFAPGPCPTGPQTAAIGSSSAGGDCSFEVDECGWTNVGSSSRTDEMDWERRLGQNARTPMADHTLGTPTGNFMTLSGMSSVQRAGDRAWMISPILDGFSKPKCISFWYYMHEPFIDTTGPSLGGLKVYTRPVGGGSSSGNPPLSNNELKSIPSSTTSTSTMTPIWRLYNQQAPIWKYAQAKILEPQQFQVIFEGIHGSSRANGFIGIDDIAYFEGDCTTLPGSAYITDGECSFEKDMCSWKNSSTHNEFGWDLVTITRRTANLADKTFGAPVGYAYFDINPHYSQGSSPVTVRLMSPELPKSSSDSKLCFSFWFSAFGVGESTVLRILALTKGQDETEGTQIWRLTAEDLNTFRPEWKPGQVGFDPGSVSRLVLEGSAVNGGFALDDLSIHRGDCGIRPKEASGKSKGTTTKGKNKN